MKRIILALAASMFASMAPAVELGDDGLHKTAWMQDTFKDLREDLADAASDGKRLVLMIEQRGCIYCTRMHEEVYPRPDIAEFISENFFVVQINMFGDVEVTDFDGEALPEKQIVRKWGALFTPTVMFFPDTVPDGVTAAQAAVATMPGAFEPGTTLDMFNWVVEEGYESDEPFQKYHARKIAERRAAQ